MGKSKLANYVETELSKGHDIYTIKRFLVKYGYNEADVTAAYDELQRTQSSHHFPVIPIVVLFILALAGIGVYFLQGIGVAPSADPQFDITLQSGSVEAGSSVRVLSELTDYEGSDVVVSYSLIDANNAIEAIGSERIVRGSTSANARVVVPEELEAGIYTLRAIAQISGGRLIATQQISVAAADPETPVELPDPTPIALDPIEPADPVEPEVQQLAPIEPVQPSAPGLVTTSADVIEGLSAILPQNPTEAIARCNSIDFEISKDLCFTKVSELTGDIAHCNRVVGTKTKDICFQTVAKVTNTSRHCERISAAEKKDSCYIGLVVDKKDFTVCERITNVYLKNSCDSLKRLAELGVEGVSLNQSSTNSNLVEFV